MSNAILKESLVVNFRKHGSLLERPLQAEVDLRNEVQMSWAHKCLLAQIHFLSESFELLVH